MSKYAYSWLNRRGSRINTDPDFLNERRRRKLLPEGGGGGGGLRRSFPWNLRRGGGGWSEKKLPLEFFWILTP